MHVYVPSSHLEEEHSVKVFSLHLPPLPHGWSEALEEVPWHLDGARVIVRVLRSVTTCIPVYGMREEKGGGEGGEGGEEREGRGGEGREGGEGRGGEGRGEGRGGEERGGEEREGRGGEGGEGRGGEGGEGRAWREGRMEDRGGKVEEWKG